MTRRVFIVLLLVLGTGLWGCNKDDDPLTLEEQYDAIEKYIKKKGYKNVQVTETGLHYVVTKEGTGRLPRVNDVVTVDYVGTLLNGEKFDSSYDAGKPINFTLGVGQVIKGWDEAFALLPVGSEAVLMIPSNLAYGTRGSGDKIGPSQVIVFEVVLINAQR